MKKFIILFVLIIAVVAAGCSGGGSSNPINVVTAPAIVSLSPQNGGPGTLVTIQGNRFGLIQGSSIVSYAGVTVQPSSWSDTQITVLIPANAPVDGSFIVSVAGIPSNNSVPFVVNNPVIGYISPTSANVGAEVTITGQYFGTRNSGSYVTFNAQTAEILSWSNTAITCRVPNITSNQSGSIPVVVWLDANRYSYAASFNLVVPQISFINPSTDNIGALVTVTGQGFGATQNQVNGTVTLAGTFATIANWSENSIQIRVPQVPVAGSQALTVTVNGRVASSNFTVAAPVASSYYPPEVSKGQLLTISGSHFGADSDVVTRSVSIDTTGVVSGVTYSDTGISFNWPVDNSFLSTQERWVTISIGGLTTTFKVVAD